MGLVWGQSAASEAVLRFRMGLYEAALPLFQQAYRQSGDNLWASYILECHLRSQNYEAAERWLTQQKNPVLPPRPGSKPGKGATLSAGAIQPRD